MRQFQIADDGSLKLCSTSIPIPKANEVLIKVRGIGVNRADLLQREGLYHAPNGDNVPGLEVSGSIVDTEQKVCALLESGGYSEFVCADRQNVIPLEHHFDLLKAASLPEALTTNWMSLFDLGGIEPGQNVLIHGGTSGIGSFAIQIAKNIGCKVFASVGSNEKCILCSRLGASYCFDYHSNNFSTILKEKQGVDLIVDILGGKYLEENLRSLNKYGKMITLALMEGSEAKVKLSSILMKNLTIIGATLRSKPQNIKAEYIRNVTEKLMPMIYSEQVTPIIDSIYKFEEVENAHNLMKSRVHQGKIILCID